LQVPVSLPDIFPAFGAGNKNARRSEEGG